MTRRVIFLRNPSQGSNFRTINGGNGGGSSRPPKTKKPPKGKKPPKNNGGWQIGDPIYKTTPKDWIKKNPRDILQTFFESPTNWFANAGPTSMEELLIWQEAETLLGDFYDIFIAQVAQRGNVQFPYGTPGQLKFLAGTAIGPTGAAAFFEGDLPTAGLSANRFNQRPAWLRWYESVGNTNINYNPYWFLRGGTELNE